MNDIQFLPEWAPVLPAAPPLLRVLPRPDPGSMPVVIAEDDPVSRRLVTAVVQMGGYRTIVTSDGHEAMTALRAQDKPCIAVVDWMMPGMDGAEICRRMRESQRNVYIIMVTARDSKDDTVEGIDHGADDYLVKPFNPDELLARIRIGLRVLTAHEALADRVRALEATVSQIGSLKYQMPL